ncbi:MAG: hypothetical protein OHK0017_02490 [Patescibacteria group bacterium]
MLELPEELEDEEEEVELEVMGLFELLNTANPTNKIATIIVTAMITARLLFEFSVISFRLV